MRSTDLHFRSPRQANPPFHQVHNKLERKHSYKFLTETRFKHGSIYERTALHSQRVAPNSYRTVSRAQLEIKKPCTVSYKPSFIESVTNC